MKRLFLLFFASVSLMALYAQTVAYDLPKTWEFRNYNSIVRTTLHEDGRLTSETSFGCFNCQGRGLCSVCQGTGGQYWYGMGIRPAAHVAVPAAAGVVAAKATPCRIPTQNMA